MGLDITRSFLVRQRRVARVPLWRLGDRDHHEYQAANAAASNFPPVFACSTNGE